MENPNAHSPFGGEDDDISSPHYLTSQSDDMPPEQFSHEGRVHFEAWLIAMMWAALFVRGLMAIVESYS